MSEAGRITYKQLIFIIFISRIIIAITYLPFILAPPANQDVWISVLFMFPIDLLLAIPVYLLWNRFPNQTIIQYSRTITGKAGNLIGILYVWFFIHMSAITLCQFCEFLTTAVMPETPFLFLAILLVLFCAYAVFNGIEAIGRVSEIIAPIIMFAIITIVVLLAKDMKLEALAPLMEKGISPSLYGGLFEATLTTEILGATMLLPYLNDQKKAKTVLIISFLLIIIFCLMITITVLTIFGAEEAKNQTFPFFSAVRLVSVGDFLERIEAVHMGIWLLGIFVRISFYYYLAVLGIGQLFNFKDYKPILLPVGLIIIPLTFLIAKNVVEMREFTSYKIFTWYSLFFIILIPFILLITTLIRKKG